ncbi:MAG: GNAT family N-acetyltransferase [Clostridia bacterium]|nr:GNAT family N-acetyltransferase [Lachnospiraceae bacterium]NCC00682.1 GNAT family N-acetyltransferase [Clostridia bacterium]NCD02695.1 GNAT family N-acetyltransferase [Clostridia bacterium]
MEKNCKEELENLGADSTCIETFEQLAYRNKKHEQSCDCVIRELRESDYDEIIIMLNRAFSLALTRYDKEKFEKFLQSGYSFVARNRDEIIGVVLGYVIPDLWGDAIYVDSLVVGETVRGTGVGYRLLSYLSEYALSKDIHEFRLQTDKNLEAYKIYKHWGFNENSLVQMNKFFL